MNDYLACLQHRAAQESNRSDRGGTSFQYTSLSHESSSSNAAAARHLKSLIDKVRPSQLNDEYIEGRVLGLIIIQHYYDCIRHFHEQRVAT